MNRSIKNFFRFNYRKMQKLQVWIVGVVLMLEFDYQKKEIFQKFYTTHPTLVYSFVFKCSKLKLGLSQSSPTCFNKLGSTMSIFA